MVNGEHTITCLTMKADIVMLSFKEDEEMVAEPRERRTWDDEFVLKRQFSALIPAFDPRPGRTNVNQTQDFDIPAPGEGHGFTFLPSSSFVFFLSPSSFCILSFS